MMKILGFKDEHSWLSNFTPCEVTFDGDIYPSVEHAYIAAKTFDPVLRQHIKTLPTGKAKRFGSKITLIPDWDIIKLEVMRHLLRQKFNQEPFKTLLLATGDAYIEETNWWKDTFWGVCNGVGQNILGKMIMEIRAELQVNGPV
jgi:ribA/ribD-fused uncharacterized protein